MPDEATTPGWTIQTSQNNQTATDQSWNDFVLDFWNLWDSAPVTEEVEVDSLSQEEEKADELNFDIDLGWDNQSSNEEMVDESKTEDSAAKDVSLDTPEEETGNDFDLSMDYEWTNEETISDEETSPSEEVVTDNEEVVTDNEEVVPNDEEMISKDEEALIGKETLSEDEIISDEVLSFTNDDTISEESVEDNEEIIQDEEVEQENNEVVPETDEIISEFSDEWNLNFVKDEVSGSESLEIANQTDEWHLFHQIDEDNQNESSFELGQFNNENEHFQSEESSADTPLFMGVNENESGEQNWEINFNLPEASDNVWLTELDLDIPEQKQPELGDLLSNSQDDLSTESDEFLEDSKSDLLNGETPVDSNETLNQDALVNSTFESASEEIVPESSLEELISESSPDEVTSEATSEYTLEPSSEEVEAESVASVESNEFLLDAPQVEPSVQNIEQDGQEETVENREIVQPEEQTQTDIVNNTASQINEQNVEVPEINISTPVELSDMSSNQRETTSAENEGQVQSTLSLDQILDSELLSNPQYTDNSKASPQNLPASGWKSKAWIVIWVGVAVLGCCVAVLAFPSITTLIKPVVDTTSTWAVVMDPTDDNIHPSGPDDEPTGQQDPVVTDNPQTPETTDLPENSDISWGEGWAKAVSIIDDEDNSWDEETSTEPVPYVWADDWESDEPEVQEPVAEEIDANQILNVILSFKSQGETYYSLGEQNTDKQLMKYAQKLLALCDNYSDKVNNWEWTDSESLASFKTTANKIISKIDTYLGGDDEEVQVIREATIDGESYFPWKDELKNYIYNNR